MTSFINSFQRYCGSKILASIILVNAGVFLAAWIVVLTANSLGAEGNVTMQWLCVSSSPGIFIRKPWTIATYMITHFDFLHLLFNMLWLYWFGIILHNVIPARRVLWLYIGGGICGALFYVAANALSPPCLSCGILPLWCLCLCACDNDSRRIFLARQKSESSPVWGCETEMAHPGLHSPHILRSGRRKSRCTERARGRCCLRSRILALIENAFEKVAFTFLHAEAGKNKCETRRESGG